MYTSLEPQVGQATTIYHWALEDGTEGGPAAFEHVESRDRPSDEEVQKAGLPLSLLASVRIHQGSNICRVWRWTARGYAAEASMLASIFEPRLRDV